MAATKAIRATHHLPLFATLSSSSVSRVSGVMSSSSTIPFSLSYSAKVIVIVDVSLENKENAGDEYERLVFQLPARPYYPKVKPSV